MNKYLFFIVCFFCANISFAQKYNVVFDVTSSDTVVHRMVTRWVTEIAKENPSANIEVVFYGKSLPMITENSTVAEAVIKSTAMKNVKFKVCEVAMKNNNVEKNMLLKGVETVPDGIREIVQLQNDGWAYIKASR